MTTQNYKILLEWYRKGGEIVGEEQINLTDEELADLMGFKDMQTPFIGGLYPIKKKDLKVIQSLVSHVIKLNKHNYYICSRSIGPIEPRHVKYLDTYVWEAMKYAFKDLQEHKDIKCILDEDYVIGFILDILKANKALSEEGLEKRESV